MTYDEGKGFAKANGCRGTATLGASAFHGVMFDKKTMHEADAMYAYDLLEAAEERDA